MAASFTTFSVDVVFSDDASHILLAHMSAEFSHKPKLSVLTETVNAVMEDRCIEALPSALAHNSTTVSKFTGKKKKKGAANKKTRQDELVDEKPLEGSVTCL